MLPVAKIMYWGTDCKVMTQQEGKFWDILQPKFGLRGGATAETIHARRVALYPTKSKRRRERKPQRKLICPCGSIIHPDGPSSFILHINSKKHQTFIKDNPNIIVPIESDYKLWRAGEIEIYGEPPRKKLNL